MHSPRGRSRGHFRGSKSQHPLLLPVSLPRSRHGSSRNPLVLLRFARILPNVSLRFGAESGAGSDPLFRTDLRLLGPQFRYHFCYLSGVAPNPRLRRDASLWEGWSARGGTARAPVSWSPRGRAPTAPRRSAQHRLLRPEGPPAPRDARPSSPPGLWRTDARPPRRMHPPRGRFRGSKSQHPLFATGFATSLSRDTNSYAPCRFWRRREGTIVRRR